jgi:hypothetical protein
MATWKHIADAEPAFAKSVKQVFDVSKHKILATLRRDGSPRLSGVELTFKDGDLWLGMMPQSRKALDLRRDPRLALHSSSADPPGDDPSGWLGDAKLSGRGVEITDPGEVAAFFQAAAEEAGGGPDPTGAHLFRIDISEVVWTRVGTPADHLVIDVWREGEGFRSVKRT